MSGRGFSYAERQRASKAARAKALDRLELRVETTPRVPQTGVTAMAAKVVDPETRALIDAAVKARNSRKSEPAKCDADT